MKVLLTFDLKDKYIEKVKREVPGVDIIRCPDIEDYGNKVQGCEVMLTFSDINLEVIKNKATDLRWIQTWVAGVESLVTPQKVKWFRDNNIILTTMSGIHGDVIAEHVTGMIISFSRKFKDFYRLQKQKKWERLTVDRLKGKTLLVVGLGSIGREIAARGKAFKMNVTGIKRDTTRPVNNVDSLYTPDELLKALSEADYVVLSMPLTQETENMFGYREFKEMKTDSYLINIARGGVVREDDLIRALDEGLIAGAGLDVFTEEPLPPESPLYEMDNVIITPHVAGVYPEYNEEAIEIFIKNLKRYQKGEDLINRVNYSRGY
ncbi:D-2-hydroxyacid dehydrogenase [Halothermothrix orenii]|uniref:D-3-phosphoglycerate dehydrogenase n=1 Tax=Halothermothrix orenii (strain H 168 / OCM 544 / DSM 9562) TaxID=373903 RepID=B8CYV5_HALOH|nr:D-2-hydroxyacid dehydrogenase [Halothermothrix orenii]ACL70474.1 D-3-phosphoglycerate dehydrogenase [Halothermothrix orenii H 168]